MPSRYEHPNDGKPHTAKVLDERYSFPSRLAVVEHGWLQALTRSESIVAYQHNSSEKQAWSKGILIMFLTTAIARQFVRHAACFIGHHSQIGESAVQSRLGSTDVVETTSLRRRRDGLFSCDPTLLER